MAKNKYNNTAEEQQEQSILMQIPQGEDFGGDSAAERMYEMLVCDGTVEGIDKNRPQKKGNRK